MIVEIFLVTINLQRPMISVNLGKKTLVVTFVEIFSYHQSTYKDKS